MTTCHISQFRLSFYRNRPVQCDFSGGQITGDAGLLPLRAFDERHHLTREWAALLDDPRQEQRVQHEALTLLRQRIFQIVAGYEDANDADRLRHDPALQIVADQKLGEPLGSQPTLSRWENAPSARSLVHLNDALLDQFIRACGRQVRQRGEILLDIDSTDDPTHGQQQFSFFNGAYHQHMYHPMLIFERHTGCLLSARLRPGNASSHARIVPMLLRIVPRLQRAFPGVPIKLRGDSGLALPLLYEFCEFFGIQYALGIPANCVFQRRAEPLQKKLKRRYRRTELPQRSFSSFRHRAHSWSRQRRICYKAEHTAVGTNLRFLITNLPGRASEVFAFYNDRGECENRIEEFKNGFRADRLSCHRFLANAFRLLLHAFAYNLVNLFRLVQLPRAWRSIQIETLRARLFKIGARIRQTARCIRVHLATGWPWQALFAELALALNTS
ncbi:MAG TPA: IS1380 family transposase [Candidatus Acidoferrales bacterium]|nr:IS1380 family transposase [Candidatus Acidoferrales bacterium]